LLLLIVMDRKIRVLAGIAFCVTLSTDASKIKSYSPQLSKAVIVTIPRHSADYAREKILNWVETEKFLTNIEVPEQNVNFKVALDQPELAGIRELSTYGTLLGLVPKISDPHFQIKLSKSKLSLGIDSNLSKVSWEKATQPDEADGEKIQGVVFSSRIFIKTLSLDLDKIEITDIGNPALGIWDLQNIALKNRTVTGAPLVIESKMLVYVDKHSKLRTKRLSIQSNIKDILFLLKISKLDISGLPEALTPILKQPLETLLMAAQDPVLKALTHKLDQIFSEMVPALIDEHAQKIGPMAVYETNDYPPQSPDLTREELLHIQFQPTEIKIDEHEQLKVTMGSIIGDPVKPIYLKYFKKLHQSVERLQSDQDMLIELNPDYMNQLLHQSYWRGYFAPVSAKGFELSFFAAPEFYISSSGELRILSEMSLNNPPLIFSSELRANFVQQSGGNIQLLATGTIKNSYSDKVSEGGIIEWTGKKLFNMLNTRLQNEPYLLQDGLPLPESIGPLIVRYTDFQYQAYKADPSHFRETGTIKIYTRMR